MGRKRKSFCVVTRNQHGFLYFHCTWDRRWKEHTGLRDNAENRSKAERFAKKVSDEIARGDFNGGRYLMRFGVDGTRAAEFLTPDQTPKPANRNTVKGFFETWEK